MFTSEMSRDGAPTEDAAWVLLPGFFGPQWRDETGSSGCEVFLLQCSTSDPSGTSRL